MVKLVPMTPAQFEAYLEPTIAAYARDRARAELLEPVEAERLAREQIEQMLASGLDTKGHFFFTIEEAGAEERVGIVWFLIDEPSRTLFVCDLVIDAAYRRRGYGGEVIALIEDKARRAHCKQLRLHVFGHNTGAAAFYRRLGFSAVNIHMNKRIDVSGSTG